MNTSNIFRNLPVDIKEVIIDKIFNEPNKLNRKCMIDELTILCKMATETLKENMDKGEYNEHNCVSHMIDEFWFGVYANKYDTYVEVVNLLAMKI